jgi:hypothetical protein
MKPAKPSFTFLLAMLAAGGILLGCATTGIQRSTEASTTMQTMDNVIKLVVVQLGATGASLDELTKPGQSDVRKAFDLYTANVSKLETLEKDFAKHAEQMQIRGQAYFEEWQKDGDTYKSVEIQKLSEQRRLELGEIYGRIAQNSIGVKESFRAYVSESNEIQRYLSNDLTSRGIQAIAPIAGRTVLDGEILNGSIRELQTAIERAQAEMYQAGSTLPRS